MNRLVANVFKIIGLSIISLLILSVGTYLVRAVAVHYKVQALVQPFLSDIVRNNGLTPEAEALFLGTDGLFEQIRLEDSDLVGSISVNIDELKVIKPYGATHEVKIIVGLDTYGFGVVRSESSSNATSIQRIGANDGMGIHVPYTYKVPCLRYMK